MRIRRIGFMAFACLLALAVVLSGCTKDEKSPKELLEQSVANSVELKNYDFAGSLDIGELQLPSAADDSGIPTTDITKLVKSVKLSWTGVYRAEPMRTEMTLVVSIPGDFALNISVPIIVTPDKLWIKIPQIPLMNPFPAEAVGKFAEIDLKALAESSGQSLPAIDPGQARNLMNEFVNLFLKHVDEESYLTSVPAADLKAPEELKVKEAVRLQLGKDQLEPLIKTLADKVLPEAIELLSGKEAYRNVLGVTPEQLAEAKQQLESVRQEQLPEAIERMKASLKSFEATSTVGIDKNEYPVFNRTKLDLAWEENGQTARVAFGTDTQLSNINGEAAFQYEQMKPEEIIPMAQVKEMLNGMLGALMP